MVGITQWGGTSLWKLVLFSTINARASRELNVMLLYHIQLCSNINNRSNHSDMLDFSRCYQRIDRHVLKLLDVIDRCSGECIELSIFEGIMHLNTRKSVRHSSIFAQGLPTSASTHHDWGWGKTDLHFENSIKFSLKFIHTWLRMANIYSSWICNNIFVFVWLNTTLCEWYPLSIVYDCRQIIW